MSDTVPRRAALSLLGGTIAVVAAATGSLALAPRAAAAWAAGSQPLWQLLPALPPPRKASPLS
ncbi:hypothetical protein [Streptomyces sp. NPDC003487]